MRGTVTTTVLLATLLPASLLLGPLPLASAQDDELVGKPPVEEPPPTRGPVRLGDPPAAAEPPPKPVERPAEQPKEEPPAQMDEVEREERFKALTQEASLAFQNEDHDHAIEAFEAAYALKPVANILYNLGRIHEAAGDIDEAIANYHSFVTSPGIDQGPREDALARIRTLEEVQALEQEQALERQAQADAAPPPPEAEAAPDPAPSTTPQRLDELSPAPMAEDAEAPTVVARSEPRERAAADYTLTYALLGTSGATLVGAGVFGLLADGADADAEDAVTLQAHRDAADAGETHTVVADALLVTGLVTGALGGLSWWWTSTNEREEQALRVGPELGLDRVGVRVRWDY